MPYNLPPLDRDLPIEWLNVQICHLRHSIAKRREKEDVGDLDVLLLSLQALRRALETDKWSEIILEILS